MARGFVNKILLKRLLLLAASAGIILFVPVPAGAADADTSSGWKYGATIYLWAAGSHGELANGEDFDIDFDETLKNLDMAFMGTLEARKSKWLVLLDVVYLDMKVNDSTSVQVPVLPVGPTVKADADVELKAWFWNGFGGYNVWDTQQGTLDLIAGARYFNLDVDIEARGSIGPLTGSKDFEPSVDVLDGVVGVRGHINLDKNWYLPYQLDAGTGQSDYTWQLLAGAGYRFGWGNVFLTYRRIEWNFDSAAVDSFDLSGPLLGARFNF